MTPQQLGQGLYELLADLPRNKQEGIITAFAAWLKKQGKLHWGKSIARAVQQYGDVQETKQRVEATVAREMPEREAAELKVALEKALSAKEVRLHVDEQLIGGAVIQKGFTIIDASVKGQLNRLHS